MFDDTNTVSASHGGLGLNVAAVITTTMMASLPIGSGAPRPGDWLSTLQFTVDNVDLHWSSILIAAIMVLATIFLLWCKRCRALPVYLRQQRDHETDDDEATQNRKFAANPFGLNDIDPNTPWNYPRNGPKRNILITTGPNRVILDSNVKRKSLMMMNMSSTDLKDALRQIGVDPGAKINMLPMATILALIAHDDEERLEMNINDIVKGLRRVNVIDFV